MTRAKSKYNCNVNIIFDRNMLNENRVIVKVSVCLHFDNNAK